MRTWHGSHANPHNKRGIVGDRRQSAEERLFGVSNLRSQNRRDAATPDRPIVRCGKSHNKILAVPANLAIQSYLIWPRLAVSASPRAGGTKYLVGHIEISRSRYPSIIRSESAVRRKNLKAVRRIADASRPRGPHDMPLRLTVACRRTSNCDFFQA
jgi:hypothetical protein